MSYQVIARKWRSRSFGELVGQDHITQTLLNALKAGRTPHALLFTGPRGTGKTSSARILAKSLRCPDAVDFTPCNVCTECGDISSGRSVDVIEIDGASNNGVDAIRELRETVGYMPSHGKYKIYIIDEVHMLSGSAFNALLKTLEEPPEHVIFVMATTEVQKIPTTILSRCQRFDFRRIPARLIAEHLKLITSKEKLEADEDALWLLARQGDGSMRDSQSLLEQVISFSDGRITLAKVTEVLGLTDRMLIIKTVKALIERDAAIIVNCIEDLYNSGYDPAIFAKDLLEELRNLVLIKVVEKDTSSAVDLSDEEIEHLRKLSAQLGQEDIHLLFDMALKGTQDLLRAQDTRVVLEMLLLRMTAAPRIKDLANFRSSSAVSPSATTTVAPQVEEKKITLSSHPSADKWLELVNKIKSVNSMMGAKLDHLKFVDLKDQSILLSIPDQYKFLTDQVNDAEFQKKVTNYMNTFWGKTYKIELVEKTVAKKEKAVTAHELVKKREAADQKNLEKDIEKHPLVKSLNQHFDTELTSIKERS